jgi:hypothetical protein
MLWEVVMRHAVSALFVVLVLAFVFASVASAQGDETVGAFTIVYDKDLFTDANRSFALTMPTDFRSGWRDENLSLSFVCLVDGLNVVVLWGKFFGGDRDDRVEVRYRFDDRTSPAPLRWKMFSKGESAWMPMNAVDAFVAAARSSGTLVLRVTDPLDGETITNTFSMQGASEALNRILPCQ